jgi:hypothetical protein
VQSMSIRSACEGVCIVLQWWEGPVSGGRRMECVGGQSVSSVRVQSECGDVWRHNGKPYL